ncbi:MAG: PaaX family transcriptional regulator [Vulcanimicrobiaceae bacterium]
MEPRPVTRPNSFIYTLYGDFVHRAHPAGGELWIGSLIRLMGRFGLSEQAVRQAVSRMLRQGWLIARKRGNRAYYALSERGARRIETIGPRIYGPVVEWDGRWRILAYSVAEGNRDRRDRLRKSLTVLGWAPLCAAIWICPTDALEAARNAAAAEDLLDCVDLFQGEYRGPRSDRELIERCWDLPAIGARYREFVARYEPRLNAERTGHRTSDEDAFAERMWLVHDFRKFTYLDPGLPSALLPAHWPGTIAATLFRAYYAALSKRAEHYFLEACGT